MTCGSQDPCPAGGLGPAIDRGLPGASWEGRPRPALQPPRCYFPDCSSHNLPPLFAEHQRGHRRPCWVSGLCPTHGSPPPSAQVFWEAWWSWVGHAILPRPFQFLVSASGLLITPPEPNPASTSLSGGVLSPTLHARPLNLTHTGSYLLKWSRAVWSLPPMSSACLLSLERL